MNLAFHLAADAKADLARLPAEFQEDVLDELERLVISQGRRDALGLVEGLNSPDIKVFDGDAKPRTLTLTLVLDDSNAVLSLIGLQLR